MFSVLGSGQEVLPVPLHPEESRHSLPWTPWSQTFPKRQLDSPKTSKMSSSFHCCPQGAARQSETPRKLTSSFQHLGCIQAAVYLSGPAPVRVLRTAKWPHPPCCGSKAVQHPIFRCLEHTHNPAHPRQLTFERPRKLPLQVQHQQVPFKSCDPLC